MNNVVYDLFTGQVRGIDRDPLPAERSIEIPYPIQLTKTLEEKTGNMVQKVNDQGQPLYKTNVTTDELGQETYTETTEAQTVTKYETQTFTYKVSTDQTTTETVMDSEGNPTRIEVPVYTTITPTSEVPVEWTDNEPIMIEEVIRKTYTLERNPSMFTKEEIEETIANTIPTKTPSEVRDERLDLVEGAVNIFMDML